MDSRILSQRNLYCVAILSALAVVGAIVFFRPDDVPQPILPWEMRIIFLPFPFFMFSMSMLTFRSWNKSKDRFHRYRMIFFWLNTIVLVCIFVVITPRFLSL